MRPATTSSRCRCTVEKLCVGQLTTVFGRLRAQELNGMHGRRPPSYCGGFAAESILEVATSKPARLARRCPDAGCGEVTEGPFRPTRRPYRTVTPRLFCGGAASGNVRAGSAIPQPLVAHEMKGTIHGGSDVPNFVQQTSPVDTEHFHRGALFPRPMNPIFRERCQSWAVYTTHIHSFDDGAGVRALSGRPKRAEEETRE